MVLPIGSFPAGRLRTLKCRVSDPVLFALAEGKRVATFPRVSGFSAEDLARRAVAEHGAQLRLGTDQSLEVLWRAARAALFLQSIQEGDPELPLTASETAQRLGAQSTSAQAVRKLVMGLPGYSSRSGSFA
jgi:hypothetical protein